MEKGKVIGHMPCPECGLAGAEIKVDKGLNPYRWCPDCNAQYFTRGDPRRVKNLTAKMTPVANVSAGPDSPAAVEPDQKPASAPALTPASKPARKAFDLADL